MLPTRLRKLLRKLLSRHSLVVLRRCFSGSSSNGVSIRGVSGSLELRALMCSGKLTTETSDIFGASLSEPHTSVTALRTHVCIRRTIYLWTDHIP